MSSLCSQPGATWQRDLMRLPSFWVRQYVHYVTQWHSAVGHGTDETNGVKGCMEEEKLTPFLSLYLSSNSPSAHDISLHIHITCWRYETAVGPNPGTCPLELQKRHSAISLCPALGEPYLQRCVSVYCPACMLDWRPSLNREVPGNKKGSIFNSSMVLLLCVQSSGAAASGLGWPIRGLSILWGRQVRGVADSVCEQHSAAAMVKVQTGGTWEAVESLILL